MLRRLPMLLIALFLAGCACCTTAPPTVLGRFSDEKIQQVLKANALESAKNIKITLLGEDADGSYLLVQIRNKEKLHRHNTHDAKVLLWRGKGTFLLNGKPLALKQGDVFDIPRGVPHAYTNEAGEPSVAVARFTPRYDGKDTEYLEK